MNGKRILTCLPPVQSAESAYNKSKRIERIKRIDLRGVVTILYRSLPQFFIQTGHQTVLPDMLRKYFPPETLCREVGFYFFNFPFA